MTRAAARTAIHEDESDVDGVDVPLPQTPQRSRDHLQRAPLGELTINEQEEEPKIMLEVDLSKPAKKAKGKKGKSGQKPKKADNKENDTDDFHDTDDDKENTPEVVEDDHQSRPSSAAEEACADLLKDTKLGEAHDSISATTPFSDTTTALNQIKHDIRPTTPPSRAVRSARKQLSPKPQTPRFDPQIHGGPQVEPATEAEHDSFVEKIETRSPAKITAETFVGEREEVADDVPVLSPPGYPSPARSPRIEDSIEAIDAAEEALEKLGQSFPTIEDEPLSPVKTRQKASPVKFKADTPATTTKKPAPKAAAKPTTAKKPATTASRVGSIRRSTAKPTTKTISPRPVTKPITPRLATTKPSTGAKAATTKPATISKPTVAKRAPSSTAASAPSKPPTKPVKMPVRPKQRVSSINKTPFVPAKSTKAPTKSAFTLPGEAVAARLKEQREKREEDAAAAATQPPTQPLKAATLGRMGTSRPSLANAKFGANGTIRMAKAPRGTILPLKEKEEKRIASNTSADSMEVNVGGSSSTTSKRSSTLHRPNTSAPRASIVTNASSTVTRSTASRPSYISKTMPAQRAKPAVVSGKEVFERERKGLDAQTKERKEKEEAARKARAEAAERGRLASREWAEKMKARQVAAKKAQGQGQDGNKGEIVLEKFVETAEAGA